MYDSGLGLREELSKLPYAALEGPEGLWERIQDWDVELWVTLSHELPEQGSMCQAGARRFSEPGSSGWKEETVAAMEDRLSRLAGLLDESRPV